MKKTTKMYYITNSRKLRVTWIVLILIFSLILVSATGSENSTDTQGNTGANLEQKIDSDSSNKLLEQQQENIGNKDNPDDHETIGEVKKKAENTDKNTMSDQENTGENIERKEADIEDTDNSDNSNNQESAEKEIEQGKVGTNDQEITEECIEKKQEDKEVVDNPTNQRNTEEEIEQEEIDITDSQENTEENSKETKEDNKIIDSTTNQKKTKKIKKQLEDNNIDTAGNQLNTEETEQEKADNNKVDSLDNQKGNRKLGQADENKINTYSTGSQESTQEKSGQKLKSIENTETKKYSEALKQNTCEKCISEGSGKEAQNIVVCEGTKNPEIGKTETKTRTCSVTHSLESEITATEIKPQEFSWTHTVTNETNTTEIKSEELNWTYKVTNVTNTTEIKPEISNWYKLKFILACPYNIHSFYTPEEKVEVRYNGTEALKNQKVDVYLVKKLPEAILKDTTEENKISLEDLINNNTESYVQIPSTLDTQGDLPPLYISPLPAGNYWLLITLAGNETAESKKILSASNFQVLEYEMEIKIPTPPKEGENIQVNLILKNVSSQEIYTYWAVLTKEETYAANKNGTSIETRVGTEDLFKGFSNIFEVNSINSESKEKKELENEIQNLIGEGNGTISIGEENQSNLSLATSALPPGNYLLFAGAYDKDSGLAGIVQKKLTIY